MALSARRTHTSRTESEMPLGPLVAQRRHSYCEPIVPAMRPLSDVEARFSISDGGHR